MDLYGIAGAHVVELSLWVLRWPLVATVAGWHGVMVVIEWRQEEEEEEEDMSEEEKEKIIFLFTISRPAQKCHRRTNLVISHTLEL